MYCPTKRRTDVKRFTSHAQLRFEAERDRLRRRVGFAKSIAGGGRAHDTALPHDPDRPQRAEDPVAKYPNHQESAAGFDRGCRPKPAEGRRSPLWVLPLRAELGRLHGWAENALWLLPLGWQSRCAAAAPPIAVRRSCRRVLGSPPPERKSSNRPMFI